MNGTRSGSSTTMSRLAWPVVLVAALALPGLAGCSSGVAADDASQAPNEQVTSLEQQLAATQQQLAATQQQLAEAVAERDALASATPQSSARHDKAKATQEAVTAIVNDPESVGSEQEVVDALAAHYTPDAKMVDAVFGSIGARDGWYETLYGAMADSTFDNTYWWVSEDGSQGGSVWLWHGTNEAGNPFELAGISLDDFNEEGLISNEYVVYPYPADYVMKAIKGAGT
jgi:regulator of replication initiation timing